MKNVFSIGFNGQRRFILIGKIKGLAIELRRARQRFLKNKSTASMADTYSRMYLISYYLRHYNLAHAFLKGQSYRKIERSSKERANNGTIYDIIVEILPWYKSNEECSLKAIQNWLDGVNNELH